MTPAEVWASLPPEDRRRLTEPDTAQGLKHLALHLCVILALMIYVAVGAPLWWAAMLPLGLALVFLFTLQHECTHRTPFAASWLNDAVGQLCGLLILQPFLWFRAFHMAHHKYTGEPDRDPELEGDAKPDTWPALLWHLSTVGYWSAKLRVLWDNALGKTTATYVAPRAEPKVRMEARVMLLTYAAAALFTAFVSPVLLWIWLIPLALGFPFLRLYLLAEHGRCPQVANMFLNTRTTLTTRAVRLMAWNMPYHVEHHAFPQVPFHKLPDAHTIAAPHIGTLTDGYTEFTAEYVGNLKGTVGGAP